MPSAPSSLSNLAALLRTFRELKRGRVFSVREGSLTAQEHVLLEELVRESRVHGGPIVEIGTLFGATTTRMALWKSPEQQIHTVDDYSWTSWGIDPESHFQLTSLVLLYLTQTDQVVQHRADKAKWFEDYAGPAPALVFCDAIHTYEETKRDIEWARTRQARCIAGHDLSDQFPGVVRAVQEAGGAKRLAGTLWALDLQETP